MKSLFKGTVIIYQLGAGWGEVGGFFFFFFFFWGGGGSLVETLPSWGSKYYFFLCWGSQNQMSDFLFFFIFFFGGGGVGVIGCILKNVGFLGRLYIYMCYIYGCHFIISLFYLL